MKRNIDRMTWNPLRKTYLTTKPSPAPQILSKTDERSLEIIFQRLQNVEESSKKMHKEMKKYLENIQNSSKAEQKITSDLSSSALCHQNCGLRKLVEDYHSVNTQLTDSGKELSAVCQRSFQEPLKRYGTLFSSIDAAFHRREQLVQEWRNLMMRVKKLEERERTASNVVKLEREKRSLEVASRELVAYHMSLLSETTQFYERRVDYLRPTLQALLRAQLEYHGNTTRLFTHLLPVSVPNSSPTSACLSDAEYQARLRTQFNKIRTLSIIKTDKSSSSVG